MEENHVIPAEEAKTPQSPTGINSFLLVSTIILLVVVAGGASYFYGVSRSPKASPIPTPFEEVESAFTEEDEIWEEEQQDITQSTASPTVTPTPTPTPTPKPSPTATGTLKFKAPLYKLIPTATP